MEKQKNNMSLDSCKFYIEYIRTLTDREMVSYKTVSYAGIGQIRSSWEVMTILGYLHVE